MHGVVTEETVLLKSALRGAAETARVNLRLYPCLFLVLASAAFAARADGGPFGIDHRLNFDDSGPWKRRNQLAVERLVVAGALATALWEGDDTRLGHTAWQSVDSLVIGAVSAEVLKSAFSRARPTQTDDPNKWFQGSGHKSFPSGEVTAITSAITPFVLEYGPTQPAAYALELLPLYDGIGRMKLHAHWQSDVLAGWLVGSAAGWYAHSRSSSIAVSVLPGAITFGWSKRF